MAEAVRLVVWDLDETFWQGTLTEGGYTYNQANHDIVIELARRGIMSSICSKNDFDAVRTILEEREIWDYFIFPSINWDPKGPRVQALIEAVQLRAETVLLIDDNHMNLEEARYFCPGIQTSSETIIPEILGNPLFKGKDDRGLTRLKQYKLLEKRKAEEAVAVAATGGSNIEFLRASNIRVRIVYDVEKHIDRAVELINRTNQLNFTKVRLPEDPEEAGRKLLEEVSHFHCQAGLIDVSDNYGDYGYCGYFQVMTRADSVRLVRFCFSCRILGMGVEAWLYQMLGRPTLTVRGIVLSDPIGADPVDWITAITDETAGVASDTPAGVRFGSVATRGGCVLWPLTHYFRLNSASVVGEFNMVRDGIDVPLNHSLCLRHALEGIPPAAVEAFRPLGYEPCDFETKYFEYSGANPIWILANWSDIGFPVYRHRQSGVVIPFFAKKEASPSERMRDAMSYLDANFEKAEYGEHELKNTLGSIFGRVPAHGKMFVLLAAETERLGNGELRPHPRRMRFNRWVSDIAREFATVELLHLEDFIESSSEIKNVHVSHFDRMVYFRIYQHISAVAGQQASGSPSAVVPQSVSAAN